MQLQTLEDAQVVLTHGIPSVNNRRHYLWFGGIVYPRASVVWMIHTGVWPPSTPRHLDNNPGNNDFANLRPPGRAKRERKIAAALPATPVPPPALRSPTALSDTQPVVLTYDAQTQAAARESLSLFE